MVQGHRLQRDNDRLKVSLEDNKKRWQKAENEVRKLKKRLEKAGLMGDGKPETPLIIEQQNKGRRWSVSGSSPEQSIAIVKSDTEAVSASSKLQSLDKIGSESNMSNISEIGNSIIFIDRVSLFDF